MVSLSPSSDPEAALMTKRYPGLWESSTTFLADTNAGTSVNINTNVPAKLLLLIKTPPT
jgi:hypothetical protein